MNEQAPQPDRAREISDADEALDRLHTRGFTAFRNGRIVIPANHQPTAEDQADFDIVKAVYRHSKLV